MKASRISSTAALVGISRTIAIVTCLLVLTGCVAHRPFLFSSKSISKVSYDPKACIELPDGKFRCRDVVFTVNTVHVSPY